MRPLGLPPDAERPGRPWSVEGKPPSLASSRLPGELKKKELTTKVAGSKAGKKVNQILI